jgi:hypothetical protein
MAFEHSTDICLARFFTAGKLRRVKKLLRVLVVAVAVLIVAGLGFDVTEPRRAANARETLDRAAGMFVQCYRRDASYERCETGTSKVMVATRSKKQFALVSTVEFGPTYSIGRTAAGRLKRSCQPRGPQCPSGGWRD